jgi:hypothetical protein
MQFLAVSIYVLRLVPTAEFLPSNRTFAQDGAGWPPSSVCRGA